MQGIDAFLDTYVRIDEGTAVLLCAHRSCARTASWLYTAIFVRGAEPVTFLFDQDDELAESFAREALKVLRARPSVRRVAVIICESEGPSLQHVFEKGYVPNPDRMPIFRISGSSTAFFDAGSRLGKRSRAETLFDDEIGDLEEQGLSPSDIDELLGLCEFEMADLDDGDIEEIAAMNGEEIGSLTDEELAALAELEDCELLELASGWGEEGFRVLA